MSKLKISKNKMLILLAIVVLISITACASSEADENNLKRGEDIEFQDDSGIRLSELSTVQQQNLFILAKVWGFVKYHHPNIVDGTINWDAELFRIMPKVLKAGNTKEATNLIAEWLYQFPSNIDTLNKKEENNYEKLEKDVEIECDISWISDREMLGQKITSYLENLSELKIINTEDSYAVIGEDGKVDLSSDNFMFKSMKYEDAGMRLLSLFRYWNVVEYFYPYKNMINEDWNKILYNKIPELALEKSKESYVLSIANLTTYIHDSHGFLFDSFRTLESHFGTYLPTVAFLYIDNQIVITNVDEESTLKQGDIIVSINGIPIEKRIDECKKYISVSNDERFVYSFSKYLLRSKEKNSTFEVLRNGEKLKIQVTGESKIYPIMYGEKSGLIEDKKIGYMNLGELDNNDFDKLMKRFKDTQGLIIDARQGSATFVNYIIAEYIKPDATEYAQLYKSNPFNPGEFYKASKQVSGRGYIKEVYGSGMNPILFNKTFDNGIVRTLSGKVKDRYKYDKKVILLMNECSISHLETTIMSLGSAPNAIVVGTASNGANGDVTKITLPGGIETYMSGIAFAYPDGRQIQRVGITPNIIVEPTIRGIEEGRDELLEGAVNLILELKK